MAGLVATGSNHLTPHDSQHAPLIGLLVGPACRLAPEHKFPAAHRDAYAAVSWAAAHASEFGGNHRRLAVGGDSAGGNLAIAACLQALERGGPHIIFQVSLLASGEPESTVLEHGVGRHASKILQRTAAGVFVKLCSLSESALQPVPQPAGS